MILHRIGGNRHINDLSGEGASLNGGRWNRVGVSVLYTSSSVALSAWEYFVHLARDINIADNAFSHVTIEVPDGSVLELSERALSFSFLRLNEGEGLWTITDEWIREGQYLCMKVPSVVVPGDFNYLVDPKHPLAVPDSYRIVGIVPFSFDDRAFNRTLR